MAEVDGLDKKQTEQLQVSIGFEQRHPDEDFTPATILHGVLPREAIATPFMGREASFWMFRCALDRQIVRSGGSLMEEGLFNEEDGSVKVRYACDSIVAAQMAAESFLREAGGEKAQLSVWTADTGKVDLPGSKRWPAGLHKLMISVHSEGPDSRATSKDYTVFEAKQICSKLPSWSGHGSGDVLEAIAQFVAAKLFYPNALDAAEYEIERDGSVVSIRYFNTEGRIASRGRLPRALMDLPLPLAS